MTLRDKESVVAEVTQQLGCSSPLKALGRFFCVSPHSCSSEDKIAVGTPGVSAEVICYSRKQNEKPQGLPLQHPSLQASVLDISWFLPQTHGKHRARSLGSWITPQVSS